MDQKLGHIEDEVGEQLLQLLYVEAHSFVYFPINLFIALSNNPNVEYKFIDTLFFILRSGLSLVNLKRELRMKDESFPPLISIERNGIVRDYRKVYENVSLKILYLFSKLPNTSIGYFYETKRLP